MRTFSLMLGLSLVAACGGGGGGGFFRTGDDAGTHPSTDLAGVDASQQQHPPDLSMAMNPMEDMATTMNMPDMSICVKPGTLHPPVAGKSAIFCPFANAMGQPSVYCTVGAQHCCEPAMGMAACTPNNTACGAGDTDWNCEDPVADCPAMQHCCAPGTFVTNADVSCANYANGFKGTHCAFNCLANEITMCTSDGECANGKRCTPFKAKGASVGACI